MATAKQTSHAGKNEPSDGNAAGEHPFLSSEKHFLHLGNHCYRPPSACLDYLGRVDNPVILPLDVIPFQQSRLARPHGRMPHHGQAFPEVLGTPRHIAVRAFGEQT